MADIYNISNWSTTTLYEVDDIVLQNNLYYYAKVRHTSATFSTDFNSNYWGGTTVVNGQTKPLFYWTPSFGYSLDIEPKVKTIQFGDGYGQNLADGINNILLPFNLEFNDRDLQSYTAILHFLQTNYLDFYFVPPAPFNILKRFTAPQWNPTQVSYDKYNIRVQFKEKV